MPKVGDLIPTRPPANLTPKEKGSEEALSEEIRRIVEDLADEYVAMFMGPDGDASQLTAEGADARRQKAIFAMNTSGKYYEFKDRLGTTVSRLVKEHMMGGRETVDVQSVEGKRFLSDCYGSIQQRLNTVLNSIFNPTKRAKKVPGPSNKVDDT